MLKIAIPIVHVEDAEAALAFYRDRLGFALLSAFRPDPARADPCFLVLQRDAAVLHVSSFAGDGVAGGAINILCEDVDALHAEFVARGVPIDLAPTDQDWGDREMYVKDAWGNALRFQRPLRG